MRNIILFDIDHTISDAFWRDDMIKRSRNSGDWEEYHSRGKYDKPIDDMLQLIKIIKFGSFDYVHSNDTEVWAITARPEKWRKQTMEWFIKHEIKIDVLLMRPENEFKSAPEIKIKLCKDEGILDRVLCIFDDREDVVEAFKGLGITALQVHAARR